MINKREALEEIKKMLVFCSNSSQNTMYDYGLMTNLNILIKYYNELFKASEEKLSSYKNIIGEYLPNLDGIYISDCGRTVLLPSKKQSYNSIITKNPKPKPELQYDSDGKVIINCSYDEYKKREIEVLLSDQDRMLRTLLDSANTNIINKKSHFDVLSSFYKGVNSNRSNFFVNEKYDSRKTLIDYSYVFSKSKFFVDDIKGLDAVDVDEVNRLLYNFSEYILVPYKEVPKEVLNGVISETEQLKLVKKNK